MKEQNIYKQTARMLLWLVLVIVLCKVTSGYFTVAIGVAGVLCAFTNQLGWALVVFVLMPFFVAISPMLVPKAGVVIAAAIRITPLLIGLILALRGASRQGHHRLPFFGIIPFLMCAAISSVDGWVPYVSFLKIINFIVFLFGLWFGTQNLQYRPKDVFLLRSFLLAVTCLLVFGSIALIPFPSISYATSLGQALEEGGVELANDVFMQMQLDREKTLFCGVTCHSQALSALLACTSVWTLCDMLFIEHYFCRLHVVLLVFSLPLMYMTRSRVALVTSVFGICVVVFYVVQKIQLPVSVRRRLGSGMIFACIGIALVTVILQVTRGTMSEWVRKTNDVSADRRSLGEALTDSRQGLMEYSLYEFRRNPLLGSGFQVAEYTQQKTQSKGFVFSASVEKGLLPLMVLGETGIMGSLAFLLFLVSFYVVCTQRKYYITISLFSVFLMTNMGEATFFSPGGIGGILWMVCVVGGFTLDTLLLYRQNILNAWAQMGIQMAAPMWEVVEDASGRRRLVESERHMRRYGMKKGGV